MSSKEKTKQYIESAKIGLVLFWMPIFALFVLFLTAKFL